MRRALAGVVPEEVLNRKRKAFAARRTFVQVSDEFDVLLETLDPMILASRGIVEPAAFRRELEKTRVGLEILPIALLRTIGMEAWLKNLSAGGLLKSDEASRREPEIAGKKRSIRHEEQRSFS